MEKSNYITVVPEDFDDSIPLDYSPEHIAAILEDFDISSRSDCLPERIAAIYEHFNGSSPSDHSPDQYIPVVPEEFDDSSSHSDCSPEHIATILEDFDSSNPSYRSPDSIPVVPEDFDDRLSPSDLSPERIAAILKDSGISDPSDCSPEHFANIFEDFNSSIRLDCSRPSSVASPRTSSNIEAQPRPYLSCRGSSLKSSKLGSNCRPIASTHRTALSCDSFAPGQRVIWGSIKCNGYKPEKDIERRLFISKKKVLNETNSFYGYGSVIKTRKQEGKGMVQSIISQADAMVRSGQLEDAFMKYSVANRLDPTNGELHHKMSLFHLRLGLADTAEQHMTQATPQCKADLNAKVKELKGRLVRCVNARKYGNWLAAMQEVDTIIAKGTYSSKPILAFKAEMLLRLNHLDEAEKTISKALALESNLPSLDKFLGMSPHAYVSVVHAQIEMALGRFESAIKAAETAHKICPSNGEISAILTNVRMARVASIKGNKYYTEAKYLKASDEYMIGLKYAKSNIYFLSNIAACYFQLEGWESCIQICNEILRFQPKNSKALLRRASSYAKLEKWTECVSDYETAVTIFPKDDKLAEALRKAQIALKESQVKDVPHMLPGPELKEVSATEQSQEHDDSIPGNSIVYFYLPTDLRCAEISPYVDALSIFYPSFNFIKVDIRECSTSAENEKIMRLVPFFVMYKKGRKVAEMVGPKNDVELGTWVDYIASEITRLEED